MKLLLWHWGRRGGGPQFVISLARALAPMAELRLSISAQSDLLAETRALGLPMDEVPTYGSALGFVTGLARIPALRRRLVAQAQGWRARTPEAAAAAREAPRQARSIQLVVSRFSGNLSWVPGLVEMLGITEVTIYCKVRGATDASVFALRRRADSRSQTEPGRSCRRRALHPLPAQRGQRGPHLPAAHCEALGEAA